MQAFEIDTTFRDEFLKMRATFITTKLTKVGGDSESDDCSVGVGRAAPSDSKTPCEESQARDDLAPNPLWLLQGATLS